jgi:histidinol-phosphate phosphatase family protein
MGALERPTQAVIVAGGRGERLRPLTDDMPKPMIRLNGRPFLEYLVDQLREAGFGRLLILEGYRADRIVDYFGDGSRFSLSIEHRPTPPQWETGSRLRDAADALDERFLFLYSDNTWPMPWGRLWDHYVAAHLPVQLTIYRNADGITRSNVRVDDHSRVIAYDRSRTQPGLSGVEIGYAILPRTIVQTLDGRDIPVEAVYPELVARGEVAAFVTDHRYYSIGSLERLPATERYLARIPAIILDRDGVLNRRPARAEYVRTPADVVWLPGALEALARLHGAGYLILVASNQAGIARGVMSEEDLAAVNERMRSDAASQGGGIDAFYHCPHGWDAGCECRKPRPGLLLEAARDHGLDLTRTVFVGDDERDAQAAEAAGMPWRLVNETYRLAEVVDEILGTRERALYRAPEVGAVGR